MSTLTFLSPAPLQTVQVGGASITSDSHGLATGVAPGSDMGKTRTKQFWRDEISRAR